MIDWKNIRGVFLDADDTLYRVRGTVGAHYAPHLHSHGVKVEAHEIDQVLLQSWNSLEKSYENWENDHITDHDRDREVWQGFVKQVLSNFTPQPPSEELFLKIYDAFASAQSRELTPRVTEFIQWVRTQGLKTGIVTNNDKRIHDLVPDLGLSGEFDHVYCASDIGYKKPSSKLFDEVAKRADAPPSSLLYIGDSYELDYQGALNAGWQVVHFAPHLSIGAPKAEKTIRCFGELIPQS